MTTELNLQKEYFVELLVNRLNKSKKLITKQWKNPKITKTRHFYVDDMLPQDQVDFIYSCFPSNAEGFASLNSFREKKSTTANLKGYNKVLSDITYAFQIEKVVNILAEAVGFKDIEPDPKLYAGGLSMMFQNDFLNPHIDNSHDSDRKKYRRLNLLYYVSPDWSKENGGNFELWNDDKSKPHTIIARQNRLIVMETNMFSWHSVSKVLVNKPRCCISNYYFSNKSLDATDYFHVTSFLGRPEQKLRRGFSFFDNLLRNLISVQNKFGRGKKILNKEK